MKKFEMEENDEKKKKKKNTLDKEALCERLKILFLFTQTETVTGTRITERKITQTEMQNKQSQ